jgi:ribosomal protein S6--L-glutamate ligase
MKTMRIALLSRKALLLSTSRLRRAAEERGHDVRVLDYLRCSMVITCRGPRVVYQGRSLDGFDAVIPRIGATHTLYGTAVVRQFETMGVYSANGAQAIARSRDKLRTLQLLARKGVPLPVTGFASSTQDIDGLIDLVGGAPLVIRLLQGTRGIGTVLAETRKAAESVIEAFRGLDADLLVQEHVPETGAAEVRALVVGDRVVAAIEGRPPHAEGIPANAHNGASRVGVLARQERELAARAARAVGLRIAGVDIVRSPRGPLVMEVHSSPGLGPIERATGIDVAGSIVRFLEKNVVPGKARDRIPG